MCDNITSSKFNTKPRLRDLPLTLYHFIFVWLLFSFISDEKQIPDAVLGIRLRQELQICSLT